MPRMTRILQRTFLFFALCFCCQAAFSQALSVAFDPPGRKRFYFNVGDEIHIRLRNENQINTYLITDVRDSGLVLEARFFTPYEDIQSIRLFPRKRNRGAKKILAYTGILLPAITLVNALINPGTNLQVGVPLLGVAVPTLAAYLGLKMNDWVGVTYNCRRNRLKPVIAPHQFNGFH